MIYRDLVRVSLALLVTAAQVAGTTIATGLVRRPDAAIYFCCCIGECACTADCCNHASETSTGNESSAVRVGAVGPTLEAPKSCGVWHATFQRGPDQGKVIADDRGARCPDPPAAARLHRFQGYLFVSLDEGLQPSSPRAPPSLPAHV